MVATRLIGRICLLLFFIGALPGCVAMAVTGAVVGTATAVAIEIVEIPFEVAGAAYDLATDDDEEDEEDEDD
jgi:hypothetical protein